MEKNTPKEKMTFISQGSTAAHGTHGRHADEQATKGDLLKTLDNEAAQEGGIEFEAGAIIGGKYQVIRKIGEGGMGVVYLVMQKNIGRLCALKVIRNSLLESRGKERIIKRFRREAMLAAIIRNTHIVDIYDLGEDVQWQFYYIAMEFVDGMTLREILRNIKKLTEQEALVIICEITDVLVAASAKHIVHRDIKPDNIMLSNQGQVKLMDLGIARQTNTADVNQTMCMVGTPVYMPPEQAANPSKVDSRADIYSLGATLYHLVTGKVPFHGKTEKETIQKVLRDALPDPRKQTPSLSTATVTLMRRMMAKKVEERFESAQDLSEYIKKNCPLPPVHEWQSVKLILFNRAVQSCGAISNSTTYSQVSLSSAHDRNRIKGMLKFLILLVLVGGLGFSFFHFYEHSTQALGTPKTYWESLQNFRNELKGVGLEEIDEFTQRLWLEYDHLKSTMREKEHELAKFNNLSLNWWQKKRYKKLSNEKKNLELLQLNYGDLLLDLAGRIQQVCTAVAMQIHDGSTANLQDAHSHFKTLLALFGETRRCCEETFYDGRDRNGEMQKRMQGFVKEIEKAKTLISM